MPCEFFQLQFKHILAKKINFPTSMNRYIKYIWLYFWLGIHRAISRLEVSLIRGFVNFDLFNFLFFYIGTTGILKRSRYYTLRVVIIVFCFSNLIYFISLFNPFHRHIECQRSAGWFKETSTFVSATELHHYKTKIDWKRRVKIKILLFQRQRRYRWWCQQLLIDPTKPVERSI